jgi:rSAM/selenodomain-associated transferase 1
MSRDFAIIMARYPTLGKVKTRLARDIGKAAALRVYRQLLDHHRREFRQAPFDIEWRYTPARAPFRRLFLVGQASRLSIDKMRKRTGETPVPLLRPQPTGDLGERMQHIFEESFARGYRRVVMIGTDAPEMSKPTVRRAFRLLRTNAAVFQPTRDGGYALVGLSAMLDVFSGIAWSTDKVMAQTRRRLDKLQVGFAELPPTFDVDTAEDLARLC